MPVRIGINGFGRIGRLSLRAILQRYPNEVEVVALNDLTDTKTNAHLFKHDSTYGDFHGEVGYDTDEVHVNGRALKVFARARSRSDPLGQPGRGCGS